MLLLPVLVTREELLLLGVEEPHHVALEAGTRGTGAGGGGVEKGADPPRAGRPVSPGPGAPPLTPFNMSSLLSLHFMKRTIFQLVLQLTELTWERN